MDVRENHSNDVSEPHDARCTLHVTRTLNDGATLHMRIKRHLLMTLPSPPPNDPQAHAAKQSS